jgi:hypothetical protein
LGQNSPCRDQGSTTNFAPLTDIDRAAFDRLSGGPRQQLTTSSAGIGISRAGVRSGSFIGICAEAK